MPISFNHGSLVKETSTTTGTGAYALLGAVSGFRAFDDVVGTPSVDAFVPYVARMGAAFEVGIGELTATGTLARVSILESSNAGAAVSWAAGTKDVYCALGGQQLTIGRHNVGQGAGGPPNTGNNYTYGYSTGSLWEYGGQYWICGNPGYSGNALAQWHPLVTYALLPWDNAVADSPWGLGIGDWNLRNAAAVNACVIGGRAGAVDYSNSMVQGLGYSATTNIGDHQRVHVGAVGETANATPVSIYNDNNAALPLTVPQNSLIAVIGVVAARNNTDDVCKMWELKFAVKRLTTGNPALVGSLTKTVVGADAGAATWDVDIIINITADSFELQVTGEAAKTIFWTGSFDITVAAFA